MKTVLAVAAMMGLSASMAMAEPLYQNQTNTPLSVDREFKTASIAKPTEPAQKPTLVLKKMDRLPGNTASITPSPEAALQRM
jgi:hypothetical protein